MPSELPGDDGPHLDGMRHGVFGAKQGRAGVGRRFRPSTGPPEFPPRSPDVGRDLRELRDGELRPIGEDDGAEHGVLELADVARPGIGLQHAQARSA